jgi:dihydrofolate reductase
MHRMVVRADLNVSLDGYATTTDATPENPFGDDWGRLVGPYTATRTFRERVLGMTDGSGTTGVDEKYAHRYFTEIGAEILGAGMFGLHAHPDDPDWSGWWGEEPPFRVPVFVLTHDVGRPALRMRGGTTFHFVSGEPAAVLDLAQSAAPGQDVRIGGGPGVVRDYLLAGLIDELHLAVTPIVLGRGLDIWDGLRGIENDYDIRSEAAEPGTTHLTLTRTPADADR